MANGNKGTKNIDTGKIDFIGKAPIFYGISALAVVISLGLILTKGLVYGIDFAGGTEIQVQFDQRVTIDRVRDFVKTMGFQDAEIQALQGEKPEFLLRFENNTRPGSTAKETSEETSLLINKITEGIKSTFVAEIPSVRRVDSVGPQVGEELKRNGLLAAFYSLLLILIYIGLRFDYQYAPGAVICLFHDAIITLGIFSLLGKQVNVETMAAILTLIGYSLNDTIINFDRVRENSEIFRSLSLPKIVNKSVNDVLARTILTTGTTLLAAASLYFIAGGVIEDFAFTLGLGIVIGTYSSIYVANPLLIFFDRFSGQKRAA